MDLTARFASRGSKPSILVSHKVQVFTGCQPQLSQRSLPRIHLGQLKHELQGSHSYSGRERCFLGVLLCPGLDVAPEVCLDDPRVAGNELGAFALPKTLRKLLCGCPEDGDSQA